MKEYKMTPEQKYAALCKEAWYAHEKGESVIGALNAYCRELGVFPTNELFIQIMDYVQDRKGKGYV